MKGSLMLLSLATQGISTEGINCATGNQPNDPSQCRMVSSSDLIYSMIPNHFISGSGVEVIMKYDLTEDPASDNTINKWNAGYDLYLKTAYDYTRWGGPLGIYGPIGPFGPLGKYGNIPNRFIGSTNPSSTSSYWNNWCTASPNTSDSLCVYGSFGPLGEDGPLSSASYYDTMYHLNEYTFWYNDYNINLDSAGVWGTQGPLGVSGGFGVLGALGPTGVALQPGMTTTSDGKYLAVDQSKSVVVRQTVPMRYSHDASLYRVYDLFEMYSRTYAKSMCSSVSSSSCDVNDSSFAVDASTVLKQKYYDAEEERDPSLLLVDGATAGVDDKYSFTSKYNQFVHLNLVPFGGTPGAIGSLIGGSWDSLNMTLALSCGLSSSSKKTLHKTTSNFVASSISMSQTDLVPFITTRLRKNELCDVSVSLRLDSGKDSNPANDWTGYYLYVTGSGLKTISQGVTNPDPDLWGLRKQSDGSSAFNINGPHQAWVPF